MKNMKKTICVLSALILSLTNAMSVSAVYEPEIIDGGNISINDVNSLMTEGSFKKSTTSYAIDAGDEFLFKMQYDEEKEARKAIDNALFTSSALVTNETAGDYEQLVISENYDIYKIGSRNNYVYYKLSDGVKYNETPSAYTEDDRSMCTEAEPSCHGTIMEECVDSLCGALYGIDGIDPINDDLYYDTFNTPTEAEDYCRKLIDSGKAEYAHYVKKPFAVRYTQPDNSMKFDLFNEYRNGDNISINEFVSDPCKYSHGFSDEKFVFFMEFEDKSKAGKFDVNSAEILAQNLEDYFTEGNRIYFQLKDKEVNQTTVDVMTELQNLKDVNTVSMVNSGGKTLSWWNHFEKKAGDANLDGTVDIYDAIEISESLIGKREFKKVQKILADINCDSNIDLYDAVGIAKTLL